MLLTKRQQQATLLKLPTSVNRQIFLGSTTVPSECLESWYCGALQPHTVQPHLADTPEHCVRSTTYLTCLKQPLKSGDPSNQDTLGGSQGCQD